MCGRWGVCSGGRKGYAVSCSHACVAHTWLSRTMSASAVGIHTRFFPEFLWWPAYQSVGVARKQAAMRAGVHTSVVVSERNRLGKDCGLVPNNVNVLSL